MSDAASLLTVGEIARRLSLPVHRIEYVIRTREIVPVGWAGNARVFAEYDLEYIGGELRRMAEDRRQTALHGSSTNANSC